MSSKTFFYLFLVITLLGSSCSNQYFYVPEEVNLLQLKNKNSLKTSISWNAANRKEFHNLQIGYSPIKHLGIFASHFNISRTDLNNSNFPKELHNNFQKISIGTYFYLDFKQEKTNGLLFDLYGGIGNGKFEYDDVSTTANYFIEHRKYSLQAGIHWHRSFSSFSFVWQMGQSNYYKGSLIGQVQQDQVDFYNNIKTNNLYTMYEATVQYTLGSKGLRGYAFATMINNHEDLFQESFPGIGGVGIVVDIGEMIQLFKKKKN